MMKETFEHLSRKCAENNPEANGDYIKDGLLYCGKCNTPKQAEITNRFFNGVVFCDCKCAYARYEKEHEIISGEKHSSAINDLRMSGIKNTGLHSCTFENDNGSTPQLTEKAKRYVNGWDDMKKKNIGLCFFGDTGTGKTYSAACIANALIDQGIRCVMTDFSTIINAMQSFDVRDKNAYTDSICSAELLIIDDLGAERQSDYALQIVEQVIDQRAKISKPLILTTNIPYKAIEAPPDIKYSRIYSRISEMTVPIKADGEDKRKNTHENNMKWAKNYFSGDKQVIILCDTREQDNKHIISANLQ